MRILIVEDEPEARDGLVGLLSRASPDWVVLPPCTDGAAGLDAAGRLRPDIIITDIRMPRQDGLAMIDGFRAAGNAVAVIVLSGYPDFEYARRCLALGVREYLLKPVTADRLLDTVRTVADEVFGSGALCDGLAGAEPVGESGPVNATLPDSGFLVLCRYSLRLDHRQRQVLKNEIRRLCGPQRGVWAWEEARHCWFWVQGAGQPARQGCAGFLRQLEGRLGQAVVACGRETAWADVPEAARALERDIRNFIMGPIADFPVCPAEPTGESGRHDYDLGFEATFAQALGNNDQVALGKVLDGFFRDCFRPGFDPAAAVQQGQRFFFAIQNHLKDLSPGRFRAMMAFNPSLCLEQALRHEDVRAVFSRSAGILSQDLASDGPGSDKPKIQAALAIIADRLTNPPSLGALAAELHLNPEYLSRLFKQEVGEGYARYVMSRRIELAKTLLACRDLSIAAVAERLGFQNGKYFFEVFRKESGQTPSEYRSRFL